MNLPAAQENPAVRVGLIGLTVILLVDAAVVATGRRVHGGVEARVGTRLRPEPSRLS